MFESATKLHADTRHALAVRLCAALALVLGATTLAGWALGVPQMVRIRDDWTPMVVNTAIGFLLAGIGLMTALQRHRAWARITIAIGVALALLALQEWFVLAFDLQPALSQPDLHRPLQPDYPRPGRMAPNTALCFLLFGIGLAALAHWRTATARRWARRAAIAVLAIGSLGVVGYSLQLEVLYGWAGVVRMAVQTGVGMLLLGTALWNLVGDHAGAGARSDGEEVAGVYRTATLLLALFGAAAGIGALAFLQDEVRDQARRELSTRSAATNALFAQIIEHRSVRAAVVGSDTRIAAGLRALVPNPGDADALRRLRAQLAAMREYGISSVQLKADGRTWQLMGQPRPSSLTVPLTGRFPGELIWDDGFVLRRTLPVRDSTGTVGAVSVEQKLDALDFVAGGFGDSGEIAVCAGDELHLHCFPTRSRPKPFRVDLRDVGPLLPMRLAVAGRSGNIASLDYRNVRVLAFHAPLGNTGLGLVVKRDVVDVYSSIRQQFQRTVVLLAVLLALGAWVVRWRLRPLMRALEQSRAEARANGARFEAAVESNLDAYMIFEPVLDARGGVHDLRYALLNACAEDMLGRPRSDVLGRQLCELFPEHRTDGTLARYAHCIETGEPLIEETSRTIGGTTHWWQTQAVRIAGGLGVTFRDITDARIASQKARHQAAHDPLTGLANRAGFAEALNAAMLEADRRGHVVTLALLDLDDFKPINDRLGHLVGDQVLVQVARRLVECVRPSDHVARLGGDEFVVLLSNLDAPADAEVVAAKIIATLAQPMRVEGSELAVTASVGLSAYPRDGADGTTLLKAADLAMYRAKRAGRNRYMFYATDTDGFESPRAGDPGGLEPNG